MKTQQKIICTFETKYIQLSLTNNGKIFNLTRKDTNQSLISDYNNNYFGKLLKTKDAEPEFPTLAYCNENIVTMFYKDSGVTAKIQVEEYQNYLTFTLLSAEPKDYFSISFIYLKANEKLQNVFPLSCLSMNLQTNLGEYPGKNLILEAIAYPHIGEAGAKASIAGTPEPVLRDILKEICSSIPEGDMPLSKKGGPWALDHAQNFDNYTIIWSPITLKNVDSYIELFNKFNISQVNLHKGEMYTQGDMEPNRKYYPEGKKSLKQVIDYLHNHEILVGMHPYTFFVDHKSSFITPIPHPDLDSVNEFTLDIDLDEDSNNLTVKENTKDVSTDTGFHIMNSDILKIDNELITFKGVTREKPYRFYDCVRGAYGTKPSSHKKCSKISQLKSYFGQLVPKAKSDLFYEVAKKTAEFYNECGFDMLYLDAINGAFILDSDEYAWYHAMLFVNELFKHLKNDPIFMCCHRPPFFNTWFVRSRLAAMDHPSRGYKPFIDVHVEYLRECVKNTFIQLDLGWWALSPGGSEDKQGQNRIMFIDDVEYLCTKAIALNASHSFQNIGIKKLLPIQERHGKIIRKYEGLRKINYFSKNVKEKLGKSKGDFMLKEVTDGEYYFVQREVSKFRINGLGSHGESVKLFNAHKEQQPFIRIEALWGVMPYDCPEGEVIVDLDKKNIIDDNLEFSFEPGLNIKDKPAIGFWVYGDGSGRVVNIQLQSPIEIMGGISQRFVKADFNGWKYFSIYETHNCELPEDDWPRQELKVKTYTDTFNFYNIYRTPTDYSNVSSIKLLLSQKKGSFRFSSIKALPIFKHEIVNPSIKIGDKKFTFNTKLESGNFLECTPSGYYTVYNRIGETIFKGNLDEKIPALSVGNNEITFNCQSQDRQNSKVVLTIFTEGEVVK